MTTLWQVPVVVAALLTWLAAPPVSLADAAQREAVRRVLMGKATILYTNLDVPESAYAGTVVAMPDRRAAAPRGVAPATDVPTVVGGGARDQAWWQGRASNVREGIARDELLSSAVRAKIAELTAAIVDRDDPLQQSALRDQLQAALAEFDRLQASVLEGRERLEDLQTEAVGAGVPLEWLR